MYLDKVDYLKNLKVIKYFIKLKFFIYIFIFNIKLNLLMCYYFFWYV